MDMFRYALDNSRAPLCYNGNLCTKDQLHSISHQFPNLNALMLGRGLIADPGMLSPGETDAQTLERFYSDLLEEYTKAFGGARNAMFRLKENWRYLICKFDGSEKLAKKLRKATDLEQYKAITQEIFHTLPLKKDVTANW